jgi:hypothetical protein
MLFSYLWFGPLGKKSGRQETHIDTLKPKKSKSIMFNVRGGLFTFWAILAHSGALCQHWMLIPSESRLRICELAN